MSAKTVIDDQEIARKIKDGSYFSDAKNWYLDKYVSPISQRSFLILLLVVCIYMGLNIYINLHILLNLNDERHFTTYANDTAENVSILRPLGSDETEPQIAVVRYLLKDYLITREQFIPSKMDDTHYALILKKVKSASAKSVLDEYKNYMNKLNPYSPFTRYRDGTTRNVNIINLKFLTDNLTNGKAVIRFEAVETGPDLSKPVSSYWEALIHFRIPDIETIARTKAPLRFLVKYYHVRLLKDNKM